MQQTILSACVEVQPASENVLRKRIEELKAREKATPKPEDEPYDRLKAAVPSLHFMSLTVFNDPLYDPLFVLEANFDGEPGPFWEQLEAAVGPDLRDMLRCCKEPGDESAAIFKAVIRPGSNEPLGPFLQTRTVRPLVYHRGNRGLDRARILAEGDLFRRVQEELNSGRYRDMAAAQVQQRLRAALLSACPWLDEPAPRRISATENFADWLPVVGIVAVLGAVALEWLLLMRALYPQLSGLQVAAIAVLLTVLTFALPALVMLAWLRWLERRDPSQDEPPQDDAALRAMARHEDRIAQNHMVSIVHVKPGVLRGVLLRLALTFLGVYLRVKKHDGYLNSMRTIHFAHWALVSNGSRLMFHSNYDGSWESYLDDFIEKAHSGLTVAWTSGVGFPRTKFLYQEGASQGRVFKAWGRHSMTESLFWFSAYREYSVNQIERHARIANGLRKSSLTEQEATAWALDL